MAYLCLPFNFYNNSYEFRDGPMAKKVLELRKPFNTIGFNGIKMAMISRNADNSLFQH